MFALFRDSCPAGRPGFRPPADHRREPASACRAPATRRCASRAAASGTWTASSTSPTASTSSGTPAATSAGCPEARRERSAWPPAAATPASTFRTNCDDGNPCTVDGCDPASGCVHTPIELRRRPDLHDGRVRSGHGPLHARRRSNCNDNNACTADTCIQALGRPATPPCTVPDNGGGTVTLPPAGCDYLSPHDVHEIIDGLPAGTTIELGAIHKDFICHVPAAEPGLLVPAPRPIATRPGGSLGGEKECSDSTLTLTIKGTGTLERLQPDHPAAGRLRDAHGSAHARATRCSRSTPTCSGSSARSRTRARAIPTSTCCGSWPGPISACRAPATRR